MRIHRVTKWMVVVLATLTLTSLSVSCRGQDKTASEQTAAVELGSSQAALALKKEWWPDWGALDIELAKVTARTEQQGNPRFTMVWISIHDAAAEMNTRLSLLVGWESTAALVTDPTKKAEAARQLLECYENFDSLVIKPQLNVINACINDPTFQKADEKVVKEQIVDPMNRFNKEFVIPRIALLKKIAASSPAK